MRPSLRLCRFMHRRVSGCLAHGSRAILGLGASVLQKTPPNLSAGDSKCSARHTDRNESKLELLNSEGLFIELR